MSEVAAKGLVVRSPVLGLVALAGGSLLGTLLVIEVLFRLAGALLPAPVAWNDRPAGYFVAGGSPTHQDLPYPKQKAPGVFRIAVVGDSFTFAPFMQLDDAFPKRIERWLNFNQQKPRVEVLNLGVPRYSTSHEVEVVRRAVKEGADLVLLQVTLNDPEIKPFRPTGLNLDYNTGAPRVTSGVFRYWRSGAWVYERLLNARATRDYERYFFELFEGRATWRNFTDSAGAIVAATREAKVPLVAVLFPTFGHTMGARYPFRPLHQKVAEVMTSHQVPLLDLADRYTGIPVDRLQVIPGYDRHPNEIAHRIAAEAILQWLTPMKILPEAALPRAKEQRISIVLDEAGETATRSSGR